MTEKKTLIQQLLNKAWIPLTGIPNDKTAGRFFYITKDRNEDGSAVHMLAYSVSTHPVKEMFDELYAHPDHHPHIQITELKSGRALLSYHGTWKDKIMGMLNIDSIKSYDLSGGDEGVIASFKKELVKVAKVSIGQWKKGNPDLVYPALIELYDKGDSVIRKSPQSSMLRAFSVSGNVKVRSFPEQKATSSNVTFRPFSLKWHQ